MPGIHKITLRQCEWCGKPFYAQACRIKRGQGRFCGRGCASQYNRLHRKQPDQTGSKNNNWKGGTTQHSKGYIYRYAPDHPRQHNNYVLEHILVAEDQLGRPLTPEEVVHHRNGKKWDNRPSNLRVFASTAEHTRYHATEKRKRKLAKVI